MIRKNIKYAALAFTMLLAACTSSVNLHQPATQLSHELAGSGAHVVEHGKDVRVTLLVDASFIKGTSRLTPQALRTLGQVVLLMHQYPALHIRIEAYTDDRGKAKTNQLITLRRAMAVADYFRNHGIDSGRIAMSGMGSANPVADNATSLGRQQNRRVELTLFNV